MVKKVIGSLVILGLIVGGVGVWQVMGEGAKSTERRVKSKTEEVKKKGTEGENKRLKLKLQRQVGTPTVQQLLDKVEANYHKIKDLKADYTYKVRLPENMASIDIIKYALGLISNLIVVKTKFYFKAPDKLKWIPPSKLHTMIYKNNVAYRRMEEGMGGRVTKDTPVGHYRLPWYTLLDPGRFDFYWRLDEIITKFDSRVIAHPETNIWVIEAVPKASNPEDEYNYPNPNGKVWFYINYEKGVIIQIEAYSIPENNLLTFRAEIKDFALINNTWTPTKFTHTQFRTNVKEEITLSNIQINIGIADSEFEF